MTASTLTIATADFPLLIPEDAVVGDRVRVTLTAVVRRIEGELIHVGTLGQAPGHSIGETEIELLVTDARRLS